MQCDFQAAGIVLEDKQQTEPQPPTFCFHDFTWSPDFSGTAEISSSLVVWPIHFIDENR